MSTDIKTYVLSQLGAGLSPADITTQLRAAGWPEETIQQAFHEAQTQLTPTPLVTPDQPAGTPAQTQTTLPAPVQRGRLRTGWMLFTQSLRVIRHNAGLVRYMIINMLLSFLVLVVVVVVFIADQVTGAHILAVVSEDTDGSTLLSPTVAGYVLIFITAVAGTFVNFFYSTALSGHVLAIFRGQAGAYSQYIALARRKIPAILAYSTLSVVIGYILSLLEERFKVVGWIISKIMGTLWALGTTFVIAIISDTDQNALSAVKTSIGLFKQNWGQTITGRVAMTGLLVMLYIFIGIPLVILLAFMLDVQFGAAGFLAAFGLWLVGLIVIGILDTLATTVLNVSLYYYAQHKTIPPAYSPELLASVFTEKKKK